MKVWVLTSKVNDYNQHGEYFEAVFKDKPTREQIETATGSTGDYVDHILSGGGRKMCEEVWYCLEEVEAQ